MSKDSEANITINGQQLTDAQSMTLRVALDDRLKDLRIEGLGQDDRGKQIIEDYIQHIHSIQKLIHAPSKSDERIPDIDTIKQLIIDLHTMGNDERILAKINDPALWGVPILVDYVPLETHVFLGIKKPSGVYHSYTAYLHPEDPNIIINFTYQNSWSRSK